jgi:tetrahydromethanopterin S-methyltransferase subunit G
LIIKDHFVAVRRVRNDIPRAALFATVGSFLELGFAAIGASIGGLPGLSIGLVLALCVEAVCMVRDVYSATGLGSVKRWRVGRMGVSSVE